jgi:PhnB protein
MVDMERQHIREGFHTVTPYLSVRDASALIAFLDAVFAAEERRRDLRLDGTIMNAEMRIGDSVVELSQVVTDREATPAALHVYVRDTDATYQRALAAGATSLYVPTEMDYGERSAGVSDSNGNRWYFATYRGEKAS